MQISTIEIEKTSNSLLSLFCSVNFEKSRINIAESEFDGQELTLWLEDKYDFKENLDDCTIVKIPREEFAKIIEGENLNSYEGTLFHEKGFAYQGQIEINEPIAWFEQDADAFFRKEAIDAVLAKLLKGLAL